LTAFVASTIGYINGWSPWWVTIPVNAVVTFVMFTVVHDASHLVMMTLSITGLIVAIVTGNFWTLAVVSLIPQRIGLSVLAWWFDWLPHHGLADTQRTNRYRATRNRVGAEWLFTPVLLPQNYHPVHHLHPSVPFYRYLRTWRRNEEAYLERNAAISTVFGQQLNPDEFREWKELNGRLAKLLPVRMPARLTSPHAVLHRIPVASVDPITADSTLVTSPCRKRYRMRSGSSRASTSRCAPTRSAKKAAGAFGATTRSAPRPRGPSCGSPSNTFPVGRFRHSWPTNSRPATCWS
jgi:Fatty acid desaturase